MKRLWRWLRGPQTYPCATPWRDGCWWVGHPTRGIDMLDNSVPPVDRFRPELDAPTKTTEEQGR